MMIEVQKPELEALIRERMGSGAFQNVEDVLIQALRSAPPSAWNPANQRVNEPSRMGADLVAAMQDSPFKEISLESEGERVPVREVAF